MSYRPVFLIVFLAVFFCAALARADEFRLVPSVVVEEDYNSNFEFVTKGGKSDFITSLIPGVEMVDNTGRLATDLVLNAARLEYADNSALDATNYMFNGSVQYGVTPLFTISGSAGYSRNSNPNLSIAPTGFVSVAVPVDRLSSSLSADYKLTERTEVVASYSYGADYYNNPAYLDDISQNVKAGLVYDLGEYSPTLKGRINGVYSYYSFPDSRTDSYESTVGFSRDFNEKWSISVDSGISYTRSKIPQTQYIEVFTEYQGLPYLVFVPVTEQLKTGGWGWVATATLNYKAERGGGALTYTRNIIPAYGLNGVAEQNALAISSQYQLTNEFSTLCSAGYSTLSSALGNLSSTTLNQRILRISPGVRYDFSIVSSRDLSLQASYEYMMVDYPTSKTDAHRQVVSFRITLQHPFFE